MSFITVVLHNRINNLEFVFLSSYVLARFCVKFCSMPMNGVRHSLDSMEARGGEAVWHER